MKTFTGVQEFCNIYNSANPEHIAFVCNGTTMQDASDFLELWAVSCNRNKDKLINGSFFNGYYGNNVKIQAWVITKKDLSKRLNSGGLIFLKKIYPH